MTAASIGREGARFGLHPVLAVLTLAVAASTTCYQGTLAMVPLTGTDAGYVKPAAASVIPVKVVGVFQRDANNAAGAAGAISTEIETGVFDFINSSSIDAFDSTVLPGSPVFAADDQTVARTSGAAGTRPYVGRFVAMEGSKVLVEVGAPGPDAFGNVDLVLTAGEDLSSSGQYCFVKISAANTVVKNDTAGGDCPGVLMNAPANAACAIVRVAGVAPVLASGSISVGARIASDASGLAKAAAVTTCNASGSSATAALTGSNTLGLGLTAGVVSTTMRVLLARSGAIPGTAA